MSRLLASSLGGVLWFVSLTPLPAQTLDADPPARHEPINPVSRQELDHVEALKLYGRGVALEHQNRLLEATRTFEEARRLDPDAVAVHRILIPLYFALDRVDDALAGCRRVLELDPGDFEIGYRYARQLRILGRHKEAIDVLIKTADCPKLKERLEVRAQVFYDLGMLQEEAGELGKAEKALREVLVVLNNPSALMDQGPYNLDEIKTQAAETYERLGKLYLRKDQPDKAIEAFQAALQKSPQHSSRLMLNLAEVYASQDRLKEALAEIEQYLRLTPQGMEGYELRIKIQKQLHHDANIVSRLEVSAAHDPHNQALQLLLAREYRKAGLRLNADQIYRKLLLQSPTVEVYQGQFQLFKDQGQQGAAELLRQLDQEITTASGDGSGKKEEMNEMQREAAQRAAVRARAMLLVLRDDADLVKLLLRTATVRPDLTLHRHFTTSLMLAELAGRARLYDDAEKLYRGCLRLGSSNEAKVYAGLLRVLALAHKNQEIIDLCQEALQKAQRTNRVLFLYDLAAAHMRLNHVRESLDAADEAVQSADADNKLGCRLERAQLLSQAERHGPAIAECQALLKEYNQSGDVHKIRYVLSVIYSAAQKLDQAEEQLLLILKDDPDDAEANNNLGYQWADQNKKLDEAEKRIRHALELDKRQRNGLGHVGMDSDRDNAAYVDSLGWVLFRKGDWQGARRELEKASSLPNGEDDPVVWDHLGDTYFRLKEVEKAGTAWRKALELYDTGGRRRPDERYREIKEKLQNLSRDR